MLKRKGRLILLAGILVSVPVLIFMLTHYFEQLIVAEEMEKLTIIAENNMSNIQYYFESKMEQMDILFEIPDMDETLADRQIRKYSTLEETILLQDTPGSVLGPASIENWHLEGPEYRLTIGKPLNGKTAVMSISLSAVYDEYLGGISLGKNGYCAMKDEAGILIMHPAPSQIGLDSRKDRLEQYPDLDPDSVNTLLYNQYHNDSGCQIVSSYWWDRPEAGRAKKLISYASVMIDGHRFVGTNVMDYNEVVKPLKSFILISTLLTLVLIAVFFGLWLSWATERRKKEKLMLELEYTNNLAQMNEKFSRQEAQMQKYDKLQTLGVLSTSIAHEYNNFLTPAMIYTEMLESEKLTQEGREILENLRGSILNCGEFSRQLKDYARQETLDSGFEDFDLAEAVQADCQFIERLKPKQIQLRTEIVKEPMKLRGSRRAVSQILINLANNAFQAITGDGTITLELKRQDQSAVLRITDTGSGMDAETQAKIYDPFFTTKGEKEGTGLGLSVVKKLVQRMGGSLTCESELGSGTVFTLRFPLS